MLDIDIQVKILKKIKKRHLAKKFPKFLDTSMLDIDIQVEILKKIKKRHLAKKFTTK